MKHQTIVPELYCSDFARSLHFYTEILGFTIRYMRAEERFAFLERDGGELMIEQTVDPARRFVAGGLEYPYGRGMNLQIEVGNVDELYARVQAAGAQIYLPIEERWYRRYDEEVGNRQFVVMDPDGFLWRCAGNLGARPIGQPG